MNIDIRNLKPNKVSYNWNSQSIAIFGQVKTGKSTFMYDLLGQDALFLACENGLEALPGVVYQRVYSVSDIKEVLYQLEDILDQDGSLPFKSIVFDTVNAFEDMCVSYVLGQNGITDMSQLGHGKAYVALDKVIKDILNQILRLSLGVHFVGHVKVKKVEDKINRVEYEKFVPSISERVQKIILADCYFMPFMFNKLDEQGNEHRMMAFRDTTQWLSGTRYKYMPPFTPLNVEAFKNAVNNAIKAEEEAKKGSTTTEAKTTEKKVLDFKAIMAKGSELGAQIQGAGHVDKLMEMVTETLGVDENGKPRMFNQLKESQVETAHILVMKLERLAKELGL